MARSKQVRNRPPNPPRARLTDAPVADAAAGDVDAADAAAETPVRAGV